MMESLRAKQVRSLYIHIPFCLSKCFYCSFSSFPGMADHYDRYVRALTSQIGLGTPEGTAGTLDTLFIGGGTPTVLGAEKLAEILAACEERYGFSDDVEISIEANPGTINLEQLKILREAGVNRLSIGVQSFNDQDLLMLGRVHRADKSIQAVYDAHEAGFANISLDLMYGLPGQSVESWQKNLEQAIALKPHHLSLYQLTIEEGTDFYDQYITGSLSIPDEETILTMDLVNTRYPGSHGIRQYEISNFARAGYECRHNIVYWFNEEFIGCGAGAVGYGNGVRYRIIADPLEFCSAVERSEDIVEEREALDVEASCRETVVMGLRLLRGVDTRRLNDRYHLTLADLYGSVIKDLISRGLLEEREDYLRLTRQGRFFANQVMAELV